MCNICEHYAKDKVCTCGGNVHKKCKKCGNSLCARHPSDGICAGCHVEMGSAHQAKRVLKSQVGKA